MLNIVLKEQKPTLTWHILLAEKEISNYEKGKPIPFFEKNSLPITNHLIRTWTGKGQNHGSYGIIVMDVTMAEKMSYTFNFWCNLQKF